MSVDRGEVDRIAALARLRLDGAEARRLVDEMNRILEHADRLREAVLEDGPEDLDPSEGEMGGVRLSGAGDVDRLHRPPSDFAPDFSEGFFVVPSPRGVSADET